MMGDEAQEAEKGTKEKGEILRSCLKLPCVGWYSVWLILVEVLGVSESLCLYQSQAQVRFYSWFNIIW